MADFPPKKNAAFTWYFVIRDADGDPVAGATALDVEFSIDGGAFADVAGAEVDEGQGFYSCPISAGEMNGDVIMLMCKTSTVGAKTAAQIIYTATRQMIDVAFPTVSGRSIDVTATGEVGLDLDNTAGTLSSAEIPNLDAAVSSRAAPGDAMALTAAAINLIWDELTAEARTAGSYGQLLKDDVNATIASRAVPGDAMDLVAGAVDAAAIATGAVDADALATDAVNEIRDAILAAVLSELPQAAPPATPQLSEAIMLLYMAVRNMLQVTATEKRITNDAGTVIAKKALTDDGTTYQEAEMVSGP